MLGSPNRVTVQSAREELKLAHAYVPSWLVPAYMGLITDLSLRIIAQGPDAGVDPVLFARYVSLIEVVDECRDGYPTVRRFGYDH